MILFRRESVATVFAEGKALIEAHHKEVGSRHFVLDLNEAAYRKIEESGLLRVFTAREDGELIGYNALYISESLHYTGVLQAAQDSIFIHPDKRGFGGRFIGWCDDELRKDGVKMVYSHVKAKEDFGAILRRQDYHLVDLVYEKKL